MFIVQGPCMECSFVVAWTVQGPCMNCPELNDQLANIYLGYFLLEHVFNAHNNIIIL